VSEKFSWNPRLTFILGTFIVAVAVVGYLVYQYLGFISPPKLEVYNPVEGQEVSQPILVVTGKTGTDAVVKINNQSVLVDDDGNFSEELNIFEGTSAIEIVAISRSGKQTQVVRKIVPKLLE
jgi:hypothetical protein